jgi:hypothetical protein
VSAEKPSHPEAWSLEPEASPLEREARHFLNLPRELLDALERAEATGEGPSLETIERLDFELARRLRWAREWRSAREAAGEVIVPETPELPLGL